VIVNLAITPEKCRCTTLWNAELNLLMEGILFPSKRWCLWKEPVVLCVNLNIRQATSQQAFKVIIICMDTRIQAFSPLINRIVYHAALKFNPMYQQSAVATHPYRGLVLGIHAPAACPRRVNEPGLGHDCWVLINDFRTNELERLTAQKLHCVTCAMCWCIVLV